MRSKIFLLCWQKCKKYKETQNQKKSFSTFFFWLKSCAEVCPIMRTADCMLRDTGNWPVWVLHTCMQVILWCTGGEGVDPATGTNTWGETMATSLHRKHWVQVKHCLGRDSIRVLPCKNLNIQYTFVLVLVPCVKIQFRLNDFLNRLKNSQTLKCTVGAILGIS